MISYVLWTSSGELFSLGPFSLHWKGLLLILAFIIGRQILIHVLKREGKASQEVDILLPVLLLAVLIGARIGHVVFFQPRLWSTPHEIFFPFQFKPSFHFVGMTGFSFYGGVLGLFVGLWVIGRIQKGSPDFYYWLDRISIVAVWAAIPILIGSLLDAEIEGIPTNSPTGIVFTEPLTRGLMKMPCCIMRNPGGKNPLVNVIATKNNNSIDPGKGYHALGLYFFFKPGTAVETVDEFLLGDVKTYLYDTPLWVEEPGTKPLHYAVIQEPNGDFEARVRTIGIARHPIQFYEVMFCMPLLFGLWWYWNRNKLNSPSGRMSGFCLCVFCILLFMMEFLKVDQSSFVKGFALNKSQLLSIPFVLTGIFVLVRSYRVSTR